MTKTKKKMLPKDFGELLTLGDPDAVKAVFETCDVNARRAFAGARTQGGRDNCQ